MTLQYRNLKPSELPKPTNFVEATIQLANCYKNALDSGIKGDDESTRIWVDASRAIKSFFKKYQEDDAKENLIVKLEKNGSKQILAESLMVLKCAEPFVFQWANRFKQLSVKRYEDFEIVHWDIFLDYITPLSWDWDSDLFVVQHRDIRLVDRLIARGQKRIIIIESDPKLKKKMTKLLSKTPGSDNVQVIDNEEEISRIVSVWIDKPPYLSRVISAEAFSDDQAKKDKLQEIEELVKEGMINAITFDNTIKSHDKTWIQNGLGNFHDLIKYPHIKCLDKKFEGFPVIIVSPGPSLEKNVHLLRNLEGRALVIAASHSLQYLSEQDIIPDIILHVDPNVSIQKYFSDFDMDKVELLILSATTAPSLFNLPARHKTWIYANAYFDNWLMNIINIEDYTLYGSCVSVAALKLAYNWGCSKIALIGQDLSFDSGKYYAGGTYAPKHVLDTFAESESAQRYKLPGYYGGEVLTKNDYRVYHGQFCQLAEDINKKSDINLFNCTEGGANIAGFDNINLSDFIDFQIGDGPKNKYKLRSVDMDEIVSNKMDIRPVRSNLIKVKRHLTAVEKLINVALVKSKEQKLNDNAESIENIQKKIARKIKNSMFLKMALQDALSDVSDREEYENTEDGYREKGIEMYKACLEVIAKLKYELSKIKI